jgi:hypothetical protein
VPIVDKNTTQAGAYITRDNLHWGSTLGVPQGPISFGFRTSAPSYSVSGENVQGTFTAFSAAEQAAARAALNLWASIANITFTDLGNSNNATIEFANYSSSTDQSEAFAFYPSLNTSAPGSSGDVFINTYYASTTNDNPGTYEFMTFLHEIGRSRTSGQLQRRSRADYHLSEQCGVHRGHPYVHADELFQPDIYWGLLFRLRRNPDAGRHRGNPAPLHRE